MNEIFVRILSCNHDQRPRYVGYVLVYIRFLVPGTLLSSLQISEGMLPATNYQS